MPKAQGTDATAVYDAAALFVDRCLRTDGSLFKPGERVWTADNARELQARFVLRPDESADSFETKLERQLSDAPAGAIQLMAEIMYVHFLTPTSVSGARKRSLIGVVLGWSAQTWACPAELSTALDHGLLGTGTAFNTYRPFLLAYLIEFLLHWRQLVDSERDRALEDPWDFADVAAAVTGRASSSQREALKHLVHPDSFEPIVSVQAKERIAAAFPDLVKDPSMSLDRRLLSIRSAMTEIEGAHFHFYDPQILRRWQSDPSRWGEMVHWAARFKEHPLYEQDERNYKFEIAEHLASARDALLADDPDWYARLKRAFGSPNNLTSYFPHGRFLDWMKDSPAARGALHQFWASDEPTPARIRAFGAQMPKEVLAGTGSRLNIFAFLLMAYGAETNPPYRVRAAEKAYGLVGYPNTPAGDEADSYVHFLMFLEKFAEEAASRGVEMRDPLEAQSLVWCIVGWLPSAEWSDADIQALHSFRGEPATDTDTDGDNDGPKPRPTRELEQLAGSLFLPVEFLQQVERLLRAKGQVIFVGPPGTGKTFIAQKFAEYMTNHDSNRVQLVQFHPSYAYEDFVEGFRPSKGVGSATIGFELKDGPLKRIAKLAAADPAVPHVLLIDEINRGNIAKVFGELYYLLEYRDKEITLLYGDDLFKLPSNLWIIGTMNTADRSIALVDAALRRRFYFIQFLADQEPIASVLRKWLGANRPDMLEVADVVARANRRLDDRDAAIGPSYFMHRDLDEQWLHDIWDHAVMPYLREHLYGHEGRLAEFELSALRIGAPRSGSPEGSVLDELLDVAEDIEPDTYPQSTIDRVPAR